MSGGPSKIIIQVDSLEDQQETLRNSRKTLKVIQKTSQKENLVGRTPFLVGKENFKKSDSLESAIGLKRKQYTTTGVQTDGTTEIVSDSESSSKITAFDLTSDKPSENYWEILAEKRRDALEDSLRENEELHSRVTSLEESLNSSISKLEEFQDANKSLTQKISQLNRELNNSRAAVENAKHMAEVMAEILNGGNSDAEEEVEEDSVDEEVAAEADLVDPED